VTSTVPTDPFAALGAGLEYLRRRSRARTRRALAGRLVGASLIVGLVLVAAIAGHARA